MADNTNTTSLNLNMKVDLNDLIKTLLINAGVDPEMISILSPTALMILAYNTLFDSTSLAVNNIKRESSLLTCTNSSSLYNQLVQHTTDITLSRPSTLNLNIRIPLSNIVKFGRVVQANTYELVYSNENVVSLDGLPFITEIDKHYIRYTKSETKEDVRVFYKKSDGTIQNVVTQTMIFGDQRYLVFKAKFQQVTIEVQEFTFSDSQLDKFIIKAKNPIYDFNLYYKDNQGDVETPIGKRLFFTRGTGKFLEYKILSNSSVSIEHKYTSGGFRPSVGGILKVELLTTSGRNIKFTGAPANTKLVPDALLVEYYPEFDIFESIGGRLANDDKEVLRQYIIKLKGSRQRIDTESDMGNFLRNYEGSSVFKPHLIVNDIKRMFNIYTVLTFDHTIGNVNRQFTVPTDSGTVNIDLRKLSNKTIEGTVWYSFDSNCMIRSDQTGSTMLYSYDSDKNINDDMSEDLEENIYYYVSPFIYSYSENDNFCRCYMDAQYAKPYPTYVTFDESNKSVDTRFINTNLRLHDYQDATGERVFKIVTEIRADNTSFKIKDDNFKAELILKDFDGADIVVDGVVTDLKADNKYLLTFLLKSDRKIYDRFVNITYTPKGKGETTSLVPVIQEANMKLYTIDTTTEIPTETHVVTYSSEVHLFNEITPQLWLQTNMNYNGNMDFILMPLVSSDFYKLYKNKEKITGEILRIFEFIQTEVYGELDMFAANGFTIRELQESLFTVSIKFAKTYGRSRFLNVGNSRTEPIKNLQLKPSVFLRKFDTEFDETAIASELNRLLISHDYQMSDLHMITLATDVMNSAGDSVSILQFINFDDYPADYHLIRKNELEVGNNDVPEVVSIQPRYNEDLGIYEYNMTFKEI